MRRVASSMMPLAATRSVVTLGVVAKPEDIAKVSQLPEAHATEVLTKIDAAWTAVDKINRCRLTPLVNTYNGEALVAIKPKVAAAKPAAPKGALQAFKNKALKDLAAVITTYEEVLLPIRNLQVKIDEVQLEIFGLKDNLKLGLAAFKPEQLDEKQKRLAECQTEIAALKKTFAATVADSIDTAIFNDILNALRIAAEKFPEAQIMAERVLEDMTLCQVAFDEVSKMLLKNITFGDGPYEDSGLLFAFCEYPERGEISLSKAPLDKVADAAFHTISKRHQTPVTEGKLLRDTATHPNLQRSEE